MKKLWIPGRGWPKNFTTPTEQKIAPAGWTVGKCRWPVNGRFCAVNGQFKILIDKSTLTLYSINWARGTEKPNPTTAEKVPQKGRSPWPPPPSLARPLSSMLSLILTTLRLPMCWTRCSRSWASPARLRLARHARWTRILQSGLLIMPPMPRLTLRVLWTLATLRLARLKRPLLFSAWVLRWAILRSLWTRRSTRFIARLQSESHGLTGYPT